MNASGAAVVQWYAELRLISHSQSWAALILLHCNSDIAMFSCWKLNVKYNNRSKDITDDFSDRILCSYA